jgi:hypothetical protein
MSFTFIEPSARYYFEQHNKHYLGMKLLFSVISSLQVSAIISEPQVTAKKTV